MFFPGIMSHLLPSLPPRISIHGRCQGLMKASEIFKNGIQIEVKERIQAWVEKKDSLSFP